MALSKWGILERLRQIKPQLEERYGLTELALFGSYARDEQTGASDIDIMIGLQQPDYRAMSGAAHVLYDLFPGYKVEVVSRGSIRPAYFEFVKPDLLVV